jgi:hypothetical protein
MSISQELAAELKDAMKARDRDRSDVIRSIETEVSRAKSEPGFEGEVDDALYQQVIASYVKKMDKARQEYEEAGDRGAAQAEKLGFEVEYLRRWLPQVLSEEETAAIVTEAIAETGASDPKEAGKVVGHIMKSGREGLDGALVNQLVRQQLGAE